MEYIGFRFECREDNPDNPGRWIVTRFLVVAEDERHAWDLVRPHLPDPDKTLLIGHGPSIHTVASAMSVNETVIEEESFNL